MRKHSTILIIISNLLFCSAEEYLYEIQSLIDSSLYKQAEKKINLAIQDYNSSAILFFIGGKVSMKLDNLDEANKYLIKAIELDNKNEEYRSAQEKLEKLKNLLIIARKTFDSGNYEDAIIEHEKIATNYPKNAIVFYNLGRIYKVNKNYDSAVNNYKKAIKLNPFEEKYKKAVIAVAQEMASNGDIEYRRQEFNSAIHYYKNSINYSTTYTIAIFKLARTYFKIKDYENTKLYLEMNLSVDPNQEQSEKMLGDIYRKLGDLDSAAIHYNKAIAINGNYSKAYYSLGTMLLSSGKLEEARASFNTAVMLNPEYEKAYGALGKVEHEMGNLDLAISHYIIATEIDPSLYDIHYRLASVYNEKKQFKNAKKSAKNCLNIKLNYAPAYFELGVCEKGLGNKVAAIDAFEHAKKDKDWRKSAQFELDLLSKGL